MLSAKSTCWPSLVLLGWFLFSVVGCGPSFREIYGPRRSVVATEAYLRARMAREKGEYELAIVWIDEALKHDSTTRLRVEKADLYRLSGQFERARALINALSDDDAGSVDVLWVRSALYKDLGKEEEALEWLERLLVLEPGHPKAVFLRAELAIDAGDWGSAERVLKALTELAPKEPRAWFALGNLYYERSRWPEAITSYEALLEIQTRSEKSYLQLASAHHALGEEAERMRVLAECVDERSRFAKCRLAFVQLLAEQKAEIELDEELVETLISALAYDDGAIDEALLVDMALRLLASHTVSESGPFVEALLLRRPSLGDLGLHLAKTYHKAGRPFAALRALDKIAEGSTRKGDALELEAQIELELGRGERARGAADQLAELYPGTARAAPIYAQLALTEGDALEAERILADALIEAWSFPLALEHCEVLEETGDLDRGLKCYSKLLEKISTQEELLPGLLSSVEQSAQLAIVRLAIATGDLVVARDQLQHFEESQQPMLWAELLLVEGEPDAALEVLNMLEAGKGQLKLQVLALLALGELAQAQALYDEYGPQMGVDEQGEIAAILQAAQEEKR